MKRFIKPVLSSWKARRLGVVLVADVVLFITSNARNVPSLLLIVGFGLVLATFYYLIQGLLSVSRIYGLRFKHQQRLAGCLTGLVGIIIALQSIGELSARDIIVVLPIGFIAYLYVSYSAV